MEALRRIRGWSGDAQFTLAAAVALIVGALAPWIGYGVEGGDYASGIETHAGELCLLVGVVAIWLLNRSAGPRAAAKTGAIAALALLAGALVLVTVIRLWNDPEAPKWGMYVSGLGALGMLIGSFTMLGEAEHALPPPD